MVTFAVQVPKGKKELFYKLAIYPSIYPGNHFYRLTSEQNKGFQIEYTFSVKKSHGFIFYDAMNNVIDRLQ